MSRLASISARSKKAQSGGLASGTMESASMPSTPSGFSDSSSGCIRTIIQELAWGWLSANESWNAMVAESGHPARVWVTDPYSTFPCARDHYDQAIHHISC